MNTISIIQIIALPASFIFGIGVAYALAIRDRGSVPPDSQPAVPVTNAVVVPQEVKDQLIHETKDDYLKALDLSAEKFSHDLTDTSGVINSQIKNLSTNIIATELEEYRTGLSKLREEALSGMGEVQAAAQKQRQALEADMRKEVEAEKQRLLAALSTKLNDSVITFLLETLQHNVDLGAQLPYLEATLNEHKEELKAEVANEG